MAHRLSPLFDFNSIALVGASDSNNTGRGPYRALQTLAYNGRYYPVNPRREEVHGQRAYPNIKSLPETPDMVVIAIPRDGVPDIIDECAERHVRAAVICSAGFLEQDAKGAELQARISERARDSEMLVIGPNCFGVASFVHHCAGISANLAGFEVGNVGVISNSGGLLNEILSYGTSRGLGFSHVVSSGNEVNVTAADIIDFFVDDPNTEVVLGLLETVRNPELFVEACTRALKACKPIVVVKMGSSEKGARSSATHTGALAGSDAVYSALFRQKGVIRVTDIDELIDMGALFATSRDVLQTRHLERAAVIEVSGGGKGLVSDTAAAAGVELPDLSDGATARLKEALADKIFATNPIDTEGSWADATKPEAYPLVLDVFGSEPQLDIIISRFTTPQVGSLGALEGRLIELDAARKAHSDRLFLVLSRTSNQIADEWRTAIKEQQIPFVQGYGRGMRAIGRLVEYSRAYHGVPARVSSPPVSEVDVGKDPSRVLSEVESKKIIDAAGIPVVETYLAASLEEALDFCNRIGYPVALKVIAPEIVHKSDANGVRLGLHDVDAVRDAFESLKAAALGVGAHFRGVTVQAMARPGLEIVLGAHRDEQFGPVVLFGLGGVFVEVLGDVALRVAPLVEVEAQSMLDDIRGRALLDGVRGQPPVDRSAICDALCRLSTLMIERPDINSVDVNPAFAYTDGLLAVDARVLLQHDDLGQMPTRLKEAYGGD